MLANHKEGNAGSNHKGNQNNPEKRALVNVWLLIEEHYLVVVRLKSVSVYCIYNKGMLSRSQVSVGNNTLRRRLSVVCIKAGEHMRENQTLRSIKAYTCIFDINSFCTRFKNNRVAGIIVNYRIDSDCFNLNQRKHVAGTNLLRVVNCNAVNKRNP